MSSPTSHHASTGSSEDSPFYRLLTLFALTAFSITEPMLTSFGATPAAFFFYDIETFPWLLGYGVAVAIVPALVLWAVSTLAGKISKRLGDGIFWFWLFALAAVWGVQLAKWVLDLREQLAIGPVAVLIGGLFLFAYLRFASIKSLTRIAAIALPAFLGIFLVNSDTGREITFRAEVEDVERINSDLPSVIFILLDELPTMGLLDDNEMIERERFPHLAAFADVATWYRRYTIAHAKTDYSVPALLSGGFPRPVTPTYANYPHNLFSLLAPTHHLTVFESITELCGLPACGRDVPGVLPQELEPKFEQLLRLTLSLWQRRVSLSDMGGEGIGDFQEDLTPAGAIDAGIPLSSPRNSNQAKMPKRVKKFIGTLVRGEPTLYFLHVQLPHVPWRFYPDGTTYEMPYKKADFEFNNWGGDGWVGRVKEYRFLMQTQYVDTLLGHIFARLKARSMFDDSLIVITSDHGRSFKPTGPIRELVPGTVDAVAYAPLLIKLPGQQEGVVSDRNILAFDLLPTIAEALDIPLQSDVVGYPASHPAIDARGDKKLAFLRGEESPVGEEFNFSDVQNHPRFAGRGIGTLKSVEVPLDLLHRHLGLDAYLGQPVAGFEVEPAGSAQVMKLAQLQQPNPDKPVGAVMGNVAFETDATHVLVAVNGWFVSGSPLMTYRKVAHSFYALLPQQVVREDKEIALYLVADKLQELTLVDAN